MEASRSVEDLHERRLAALESRQGAQGATEEPSAVVEKPTVRPVWREYRDLVTLKPEPGEEQVYSDATAVIVDWRRARVEHAEAGDRLSRAMAE